MPQPELIYKIADRAVYEAALASGQMRGMPVDLADGFVHFSSAGQLRGTLARHFAGQSGLMLLAVRVEALGEALRWEVSRGGELLPHLYAPLPMQAVAWTTEISVAANGDAVLPEALR